MQSSARLNWVMLALAAILACGTGAYANSFSWLISGTNVSGSGSLQATAEAGGWYLVTSMTGNLYVGGIGGAITLTPYTGPPGTYGTDPSGLYIYDDLVNPSSPPELHNWGLVFGVTGFTDPMNLCADPGCHVGSGIQVWLIDHVNGSYSFYPVEFTTPEPSALALLSLGLVAFALALAWNRRERREMAI
jgi:hypothetical protein